MNNHTPDTSGDRPRPSWIYVKSIFTHLIFYCSFTFIFRTHVYNIIMVQFPMLNVKGSTIGLPWFTHFQVEQTYVVSLLSLPFHQDSICFFPKESIIVISTLLSMIQPLKQGTGQPGCLLLTLVVISQRK